MSKIQPKSKQIIVFLLAVLAISFLAFPVFYGSDITESGKEIYPVPVINGADVTVGHPSSVIIPDTVDKVSVLDIPISADKIDMLKDPKNSVEVANLAQGKKTLRVVDEAGNMILSHEVDMHRACVGGFCSTVPGVGVDGCTVDADCAKKIEISGSPDGLSDSPSSLSSPIRAGGYAVSVVESEKALPPVKSSNAMGAAAVDTKEIKRELLIAVASPEAVPSGSSPQSLAASKNKSSVSLLFDSQSGNPLALTVVVPTLHVTATPTGFSTVVPTVTPVTTPNTLVRPTTTPTLTETSVPTGTVTAEPTDTSTPKDQHNECEYGKCRAVEGYGSDLCVDGGCDHRECVYDVTAKTYACESKPTVGRDECTTPADCKFRLGTFCGTNVLGFTECANDFKRTHRDCEDRADCLTNKRCATNKTCSKTGNGRSCDEDADCTRSDRHSICDRATQRCREVKGAGKDECLLNTDCQIFLPRHYECIGRSCRSVNGKGKDTCKIEGDCFKASDSSYCSVVQSHSVAVYKCEVVADGKGNQECTSDFACLPAEYGTYCDNYTNGGRFCRQDLTITTRECNSDYECAKSTPNPTTTPKVVPTTSVESKSRPMLSSADIESLNWHNSIIGSDSAKVKVEIFQDIDCGMCKFAYFNMYLGLLEDYVSKGKARLVIKEYPLIPDSESLKAARAMVCASEQNLYGPFTNGVYSWDKKVQGSRNMEQIAKNSGLDLVKFNSCIVSESAEKTVSAYIEEGKSKGISGTPSVFVNGAQVGGAMDFKEFQGLIEKALNK